MVLLLTADKILCIFRTSLGRLTLLFIGWRFAPAFVTLFGLSFFANADVRSNTLAFPNPSLDYWNRWGSWDGGHYQSIAVKGYAPHQTMWFRAYPMLIKILVLLGMPSLGAGLIVSHTAAFAALYYLYRLAQLDFGEGIARRAIVAALIFPTSFYFVAVFNESLFLAVTVASFYYARRDKWMLAAMLAAIAGATRVMGLATIAAVSAEYLLQRSNSAGIRNFVSGPTIRLVLVSLSATISLNLLRAGNLAIRLTSYDGLASFLATASAIIFSAVAPLEFVEVILRRLDIGKLKSREFAYLALSPAPLLAYLIYQQLAFGSAFSFLAYEAKSYNKVLNFPLRGPQDAIAIVVQRGLLEIGDGMRFLTYIIFFTAMVVGLIVCLDRYRTSYAIYYFLATLIPPLSGTLMDMPRYSLTLFPFFFVVAHIRNDFLQTVGILFSVVMLSALAMLFINGYWFM